MQNRGTCHCGRVVFETDAALTSGMTCNCSICHRSGMVLSFVPAAQVRIVQGEEVLKDYQFGRKHLHHYFCGECGVRPFGKGVDPRTGETTFALNLRCIDAINLESVQIQTYDGKSIPL